MLELKFDPFPVITTDRLVLRRITEDDVQEMFFMRSDEEVMRYIARPRAKTPEDALAFIRLLSDNLDKNEGITWAIALEDDPKLIGTICFWNIRAEHYRAELGYALHPAHQRKGIMSEAIKALLNYGFNTLRLHSIEAQLDPENIASVKTLEKAGFIREGYYKEDFFYDGRFMDTAVYSRLALGIKI